MCVDGSSAAGNAPKGLRWSLSNPGQLDDFPKVRTEINCLRPFRGFVECRESRLSESPLLRRFGEPLLDFRDGPTDFNKPHSILDGDGFP
jgi:hypothetical protein